MDEVAIGGISHPLRLQRRRQILIGAALACNLLGLAAAGSAGVRARPLLVYNASASAPVGFYRTLPPDPIARGALVLARMPAAVTELAARRDYLPASVPLVKRIAGLNGDRVCGDGAALRINGRPVARSLRVDGRGRPLAAWRGCRALAAQEILLLTPDNPAAYDGRYFGPSPRRDIIARLVWIGRP